MMKKNFLVIEASEKFPIFCHSERSEESFFLIYQYIRFFATLRMTIVQVFLIIATVFTFFNINLFAQQPKTAANFFQYISSLKLPNDLEFCGEKIPMEIPEIRERAEREFYMLLQQPGQIMLYLKRSGRYFPMYERILKDNIMPSDLKYLSVAESALYMARSSKNALGLWQFIASTGKSMGLQIDNYVDERCHPEKSTEAAVKYLKAGYRTHGSWILTVAGYNMGHENVVTSMSYQSSDDYFDLFLNEETSRFIFRIVIIKEIMKNAAKYGFELNSDDYYKSPQVKTIKVETNIANLADWAISQGTTYKDVKLLNPWILQRRLPSPSRGNVWEIDIPAK